MTTDSGRCLTCGHKRMWHDGLQWHPSTRGQCHVHGCTCATFDPVDPKVEGTPDLHQAIQAMLRDSEPTGPPYRVRLLLDDERAVLKAALDQLLALRSDVDGWRILAQKSERRIGELLEQLQATRDRHADLEARNALGAEQVTALLGTVKYWEDRHATLQTQVDQLRDLLEQLHDADIWSDGWYDLQHKVAAVLQVPGPATGPTIHHEVQRLRTFEQAVRQAIRRSRYGDIIAGVATALADLDGTTLPTLDALDQAAPREDDR